MTILSLRDIKVNVRTVMEQVLLKKEKDGRNMENKVINQMNMRETNLNEVLKIIREHGPLTRRKLQEITGLSWGGTSQIVTRLLNQNLILEEKDNTQTAGRKPTCLRINGQNNLILGIDVNSSGLTAVVQNLQNEILEQTEGEADCSDQKSLLNSIFALLDPLYEKYRRSVILGCGISMQSAVDEKNGISLYLKECPDWKDVPLCEIFAKRYGIATYLAHDPDCLVASNVSLFGEDVILLRMDYSIGMSVFKDGTFIKSPGMLEIGNTLICTENNEIKRLEDSVTITAMEQKAGCDIRELAKNTKGQKVIEKAAATTAVSAANASILFDISTILICGKLVECVPEFYEELNKNIKKYLTEEIKIFLYDEKKAAAGAAWMAANRLTNGG